MREFFKGWRRKVGCAALVMAMTLLVAWMRSQFVSDRRCLLEYDSLSRHLIAESKSGWLSIFEMKVIQHVDGSRDIENSSGVSINYLTVIAPLTLLSAYLILWKPRTNVTPNA
jgi:hypothetical protein